MAKKGYREESDSIGIVYVPRKALYGAQTQRAIDNFPISGIKMDFPFTKSFVSSLGVIKDAAARANKGFGKRKIHFYTTYRKVIYGSLCLCTVKSFSRNVNYSNAI